MLCQEIHVRNLLAKYPTKSLSLASFSSSPSMIHSLRLLRFDSFSSIHSIGFVHFESCTSIHLFNSPTMLLFILFDSFDSIRSLRAIHFVSSPPRISSICSLSYIFFFTSCSFLKWQHIVVRPQPQPYLKVRKRRKKVRHRREPKPAEATQPSSV
jgi:hypothetical protein